MSSTDLSGNLSETLTDRAVRLLTNPDPLDRYALQEAGWTVSNTHGSEASPGSRRAWYFIEPNGDCSEEDYPTPEEAWAAAEAFAAQPPSQRDGEVKRYVVEWQIEVRATHASAAAVEALRIMRRPKRIGAGDPVVFSVMHEDFASPESVDLDEMPDQPDLRALLADPVEYADPMPRAALNILVAAAEAHLEDLTTGVDEGLYDDTKNDGEIGDIERALRYVPPCVPPDPWHIGVLPGDDGSQIRDENGLLVYQAADREGARQLIEAHHRPFHASEAMRAAAEQIEGAR